MFNQAYLEEWSEEWNKELEEEGLQESLDYCDKIIAEGDELERDFFSMVKRVLLSGENTLDDMIDILDRHERRKV